MAKITRQRTNTGKTERDKYSTDVEDMKKDAFTYANQISSTIEELFDKIGLTLVDEVEDPAHEMNRDLVMGALLQIKYEQIKKARCDRPKSETSLEKMLEHISV